jgi:hypothetical protein
MKVIDMTGKKFGRLLVLERHGTDSDNKATWVCQCECGNQIITQGKSLRKGFTVSCGCFRVDLVAAKNTTHGKYGTPENRAWNSMKRRCYNSHSKDYENYGGRGITVCERWINSFENFLSDMGLRPSSQHSIDRKNVNGNYEPSNCKWATPIEQRHNRRDSVKGQK